jgi:hypothetical protein
VLALVEPTLETVVVMAATVALRWTREVFTAAVVVVLAGILVRAVRAVLIRHLAELLEVAALVVVVVRVGINTPVAVMVVVLEY